MTRTRLEMYSSFFTSLVFLSAQYKSIMNQSGEEKEDEKETWKWMSGWSIALRKTRGVFRKNHAKNKPLSVSTVEKTATRVQNSKNNTRSGKRRIFQQIKTTSAVFSWLVRFNRCMKRHLYKHRIALSLRKVSSYVDIWLPFPINEKTAVSFWIPDLPKYGRPTSFQLIRMIFFQINARLMVISI